MAPATTVQCFLYTKSNKSRSVATFQGTIAEFHKFIGPKVRNDIQILTKARKRELGFVCEECGRKRELEAAHFGRSRLGLIQDVLGHYAVEPDGSFTIDLEEVRQKILDAHRPIQKHVR